MPEFMGDREPLTVGMVIAINSNNSPFSLDDKDSRDFFLQYLSLDSYIVRLSYHVDSNWIFKFEATDDVTRAPFGP